MKHLFLIAALLCCVHFSFAQNEQGASSFVFPDSTGWNVINEGQLVQFQVKSTHPSNKIYFSIAGTEDLGIEFDSTGLFRWTPSFDLVDRVQKSRDVNLIFEQALPDGKRERKEVTFILRHVNRPPEVEELPVLYVKQSSVNNYQIPQELAYDPDGDPLVFKSNAALLPEGVSISQQGVFSWKPSRTQFISLRNNPLIIEFTVQDQPDKLETTGKLRIAQTQQDLPPDIMVVPGDSAFAIKEDETLNLKIYITDPNGDDDVKTAGLITADKRIGQSILKENTPLQYEVTWTPGYEFVEDTQPPVRTDLVIFSIDQANNRSQRKITVRVSDAENLIKKDAHQFQKYRGNLVDAVILAQQLDANQKKLNSDYKKAKKGKKHRSIVNASLGAVTGATPAVVQNTQDAKVIAGVGGTTVLTFGTLEATEVIGRSKEGILEKIKITIDIRNKIQGAADDFARKYALKAARRSPEFEKDIEKFRTVLSDQRIVLLELDAYSRGLKISDKDVKSYFVDFVEEQK